MNARNLLAIDKAKIAWGDTLPVWVRCLAEAADKSSMSSISRKLGLSVTVISQGINNKYGADGKGNIQTLISAVETYLMEAEIRCPAMGEMMLKSICEEWQKSAVSQLGSNPYRAAMAVNCRRCPNSKIPKDN